VRKLFTIRVNDRSRPAEGVSNQIAHYKYNSTIVATTPLLPIVRLRSLPLLSSVDRSHSAVPARFALGPASLPILSTYYPRSNARLMNHLCSSFNSITHTTHYPRSRNHIYAFYHTLTCGFITPFSRPLAPSSLHSTLSVLDSGFSARNAERNEAT
jgi:hypothetical protein